MEEKIFKMMEKMYVEFSNKFEKIDQRFDAIDQRFEAMDQRFETIDQRFEAVDQRFGTMEQEFANVRHEIRQESARLENVLGAKIDALRDGYIQNEARLTRVENRLEAVEDVIQNKSIVVGSEYYIQLFPKTKEPA